MTEPKLCAHCHGPIDAPRGARGPERQYCSGACRQAAFRAKSTETPTPAASVANLMMSLGEMFAPIAETAVGLRHHLETENGYSPTMAEMISGQYHAALMKGMVEYVFAAQIKELAKG